MDGIASEYARQPRILSVTQTSNHIINGALAKQSHAPFLQLERDKK